MLSQNENFPLKLRAASLLGQLVLHRLEANIQPDNLASTCLVRPVGFQKKGGSPRCLSIAGSWLDHERWTFLADDPNG